MRKLQNISDVSEALEEIDFIVRRLCILVFVWNSIFSPFFLFACSPLRSIGLEAAFESRVMLRLSLFVLRFMLLDFHMSRFQLRGSSTLMTPRVQLKARDGTLTPARSGKPSLHTWLQFCESSGRLKRMSLAIFRNWDSDGVKMVENKINNRRNPVNRIGLIRILVWSFHAIFRIFFTPNRSCQSFVPWLMPVKMVIHKTSKTNNSPFRVPYRSRVLAQNWLDGRDGGGTSSGLGWTGAEGWCR